MRVVKDIRSTFPFQNLFVNDETLNYDLTSFFRQSDNWDTREAFISIGTETCSSKRLIYKLTERIKVSVLPCLRWGWQRGCVGRGWAVETEFCFTLTLDFSPQRSANSVVWSAKFHPWLFVKACPKYWYDYLLQYICYIKYLIIK